MRFTPRSRRAWRRWLEDNHSVKDEVWVVFHKRHTSKPTLSYNDAVEEAICFGWIDGMKRRIDDARYMHRFTPRASNSRWSDTNKKRVERMTNAGQMMPAGEAAVRHAQRNGRWDEAAPKFDFEIPPELAERFGTNATAAENFDALAPSYQRQYVGWITAAKRPDTRARRVAEAIELLGRGEKLGMR